MRFPVRLEHFPTSRNYALPSIFNLARSFGVGPDQMGAANKARRQSAAGETVKSRVTPPDKDAISRTCPGNDRLDNRQTLGCLLTKPERHDKKNDSRHGRRGDD